ncbi:MAG: DUF2460 domain-containing protein [Micropepsaceae bacterium]
MTFHEVRFPASVSFGSMGGPERRTEIVTLGSGREERNTPWAHGRRRYDAGLGLTTLDELHDVIAFFEARRGRLHGFRWRDHLDAQSCTPLGVVDAGDQALGLGDGVRTAFQLVKTYGDAGGSYVRPIVKPVAGTVRVAVDGAELMAGWSVDVATGVVTFAVAPGVGASVTAGFQFDVPVRFDTDRLSISLAAFRAGEAPDIPVIEIWPVAEIAP